jgi:hypothetical protein
MILSMGIIIANGIKSHRRGACILHNSPRRVEDYTAQLDLNHGTTMARTTSCASSALM